MPSVTVTALASDSRGLDDGKFTETAVYDIQRHYILGKGNILKKTNTHQLHYLVRLLRDELEIKGCVDEVFI